jgi:hypothetical protein
VTVALFGIFCQPAFTLAEWIATEYVALEERLDSIRRQLASASIVGGHRGTLLNGRVGESFDWAPFVGVGFAYEEELPDIDRVPPQFKGSPLTTRLRELHAERERQRESLNGVLRGVKEWELVTAVGGARYLPREAFRRRLAYLLGFYCPLTLGFQTVDSVIDASASGLSACEAAWRTDSVEVEFSLSLNVLLRLERTEQHEQCLAFVTSRYEASKQSLSLRANQDIAVALEALERERGTLRRNVAAPRWGTIAGTSDYLE